MSDSYVSYNDPATAKSIAEKYGFCLVRGVFTADEMTDMEARLAAAHDQFGGDMPDIHVVPQLNTLLSDPRVQALARSLVGPQPVYYRETHADYEKEPGPLTEKPFMEFHCDARGSRRAVDDSPQDKPGQVYPSYRFGIYFRNYRDFSGGLKVAPASHLQSYSESRDCAMWHNIEQLPRRAHPVGDKTFMLPELPVKLYNVPSLPGDIVIFNLRTFHSAGALRPQGNTELAVLPVMEVMARADSMQLFLPPPPGSRNAIFFDFAAPREDVDFYIKWRALFTPSSLHGHDYTQTPPSEFLMRNDRVIVALALRLIAALDGAAQTPAAQTPAAQKDAADLMILCERHVEFSAYHPLFDRKLLTAGGDSFAAAVAVARSVIACRDKAFAAAAARKAANAAPALA